MQALCDFETLPIADEKVKIRVHLQCRSRRFNIPCILEMNGLWKLDNPVPRKPLQQIKSKALVTSPQIAEIPATRDAYNDVLRKVWKTIHRRTRPDKDNS